MRHAVVLGSRERAEGRLPCVMANTNSLDRPESVEQRRRLERFVVGYKSLEGLASIIAGFLARSAALTAFGITSLIQAVSAAACLRGQRYDAGDSRREEVQRRTVRAIGFCLTLLGTYVAYDSVSMLARRQAPDQSIPGIIIPFISLDVLLLVSEKKQIDSPGVEAGCTLDNSFAYLPAILLGGLLLHALFGWWWADPGAAVLMTPILVKGGLRRLNGNAR
jgi:divalent metal cation (Fe/Co/Zn/Cd) transporter